ncbi:MAG: integral membrane [Lasallia pustulata]|uniref:Integral membrane n=1 Tax=Lasallia pustulata TaxID=136370 RepID=A0A1W5CTR1_9LECA|nr:MAG: integral membrane [Lasallia pustulata]SLM34201.1 Domain of unknown function DUF2470 [Lasallia pustulata]
MADQSANDAAAKQRIISHMNSDHQDSLRRYLEHYSQVSSFAARDAKLADITFSSMVILSSSGYCTVPISPPLTRWSQARERAVAMDAEATAGLGRSNITVKKYKKPKGFLAVVFVAAACTFVVFSKRSNFEPGSFIYDHVLKHTPGFAQWCYKIQPLVIYPMIALHGWEAYHMQKSRLEKHNIPFGSRLWWKWVLSTFIEGVGAFMRFDRIVAQEKEKKEKARH